MCTALEGMDRVTQNPFLNANVNFDGSRNGVQTCDKIGKINFSAWKEEKKAPTAQAPPSDGSSDKTPNVDVNHAEVACRMTGARRKGIIICGNNGDFTDTDLDSVVQSIEDNNAVPIRGKTATIKGRRINDLYIFHLLVVLRTGRPPI